MKKWIPLFSTNFFGVFNDNLLKNLIWFVSYLWVANAEENKELTTGVALLLFVLPYILFSPYAGILAKRYSKKRIIVISKIIEVPIMMIAIAAFFMQSIWLVMIALLFMGVQSSMFSPSKYGLIRDIGGKEGVSFGAGTMELITFLAVNIGFFAAGRLAVLETNAAYIIASVFLVVAFIGYITSLLIKAKEPPPIREAQDTKNPITFIIRSFKWGEKNAKGLNWVVISLSTFWLIGSLIQLNSNVYCTRYLEMEHDAIGDLMGLMGIGIGLGCFLAGVLSGKGVNLSLILIGNFGLSLFVTLIYVMEPNQTLFKVFLIGAAIFSGFYKIPLNAWIQYYIKGRKLGEIIGYNNLMVFVFLFVSAALFIGLSFFIDTRTQFLVIALISWTIGILMFFKIPGVKSSISKTKKKK